MHIGRIEDGLSDNLPTGHVGGNTLTSILSVQGDWFCLKIAHDTPRPTRLFLSRVMLWALAKGPDVVDHTVGIGETGDPQEDPFTEVYYVYGTDLSPNGSTWGDVYSHVKPSLQQVREVTHLFEGQE